MLEDLVLFVGGFDTKCQCDLQKLTVEEFPFRTMGGQSIGIACKLHGQGGGPLSKMPPLYIFNHGARDTARVNPPVVFKSLILSCNESLAEVG